MLCIFSLFLPATLNDLPLHVLATHRRSARDAPVMRRFMRNTRRKCSGRAFAASWYVTLGQSLLRSLPSITTPAMEPCPVSDLTQMKTTSAQSIYGSIIVFILSPFITSWTMRRRVQDVSRKGEPHAHTVCARPSLDQASPPRPPPRAWRRRSSAQTRSPHCESFSRSSARR
jgi:hypothetical protein